MLKKEELGEKIITSYIIWPQNILIIGSYHLDTSPVMHDDNWISIVFCAVFMVPHEILSTMGFSKAQRRCHAFGDIQIGYYYASVN